MSIAAKIITLSEAKEMYDTYTTRRVAPIETYEKANGNDANFKAVRYGEWTFAELKEYVAHLETVNSNIKDLPGYSKGIDRVRLYFGAYPNKTHLNSGKEIPSENNISYAGRSTFFLIPTVLDGGEQKPFALERDTYNPSILTNDLTRVVNTGDIDSLAINEANLTPPPN